jgi:hypothetical protein
MLFVRSFAPQLAAPWSFFPMTADHLMLCLLRAMASPCPKNSWIRWVYRGSPYKAKCSSPAESKLWRFSIWRTERRIGYSEWVPLTRKNSGIVRSQFPERKRSLSSRQLRNPCTRATTYCASAIPGWLFPASGSKEKYRRIALDSRRLKSCRKFLASSSNCRMLLCAREIGCMSAPSAWPPDGSLRQCTGCLDH